MTSTHCVRPTHPEGDRVRLQATLSDDEATVKNVSFTGDECTLSQAGYKFLYEQMTFSSVL